MSRTYTAEEERVASYFARALLMPEREFREQVELHADGENNVALKPIAEYFHADVTNVHLRGVDLGLFHSFP